MICDSCKKERLVTDFINNQKFCYYCEYRKKLEKTPEKRTMFCRVCSKEITHVENVKKRQRTVFCSYECAEKGYNETRDNHWTRKLRVRRAL